MFTNWLRAIIRNKTSSYVFDGDFIGCDFAGGVGVE